jgi:ADP-L-glycero-D-manno-heptose 6-epimerase
MIIVTGGAGFIGSNIVAGLNESGEDDILIVDNLKNGDKHLNLNNRKFRDFIPKENLFDELQGLVKIKLVLHHGACSDTTETDGRYMMDNNYEYSKKLLNFCTEKKIPFIYASSASVYGSGEKGFDDRSDDYFPLNVYAYSKLQFDRYVRQFLREGKNTAQVTGLRYFNVYGYQENHKGDMASVPFKFFRQMKDKMTLGLFEGSDRYFRDFIFIEDVVGIVSFFLEKSVSGIYNAGTGLHRSFQDIAGIFKAHYPGLNVNYIPLPAHLVGKYQQYTQADLTRLRELGYTRPFHSLEAGISKYLTQLERTGGFL